MFLLFFILGFSTTVQESNSYALLNVTKHDSHSKVATIQTRQNIPSYKDDFNQKMEQESGEVSAQNAKTTDEAEDIESEGLAIPEPATSEPTLRQLIAMVGRRFARGPAGPIFKARDDEYLLQPESVKLRSGQSSVYNVKPNTIVTAIQDLLSSTTLRRYLDKLSRKAAAVYRALDVDMRRQ